MEARRRSWSATGAPHGSIAGLTVDVQRLPGRTPLIVFEVPATDPALAERTVLLYGHLDKQPEMTGWREGLGPWTPVIEGDRLYGRGGADDGYAAFAVAPRHRGRRRPTGIAARPLRAARSRPARRAAAPTCRPTSTRWPIASARRSSWSASTPAASTTERLWITTSLRGLVGGDADRRGARRGRALRRGQRRGAVELPHHPPAARPRRGRAPPGEVLLARAARRRSRPTGSPRPRRHGGRADPSARRGVPVRRVDPADDRRPRRAAPRPDVATDAQLHRRRRHSRRPAGPATCCARRRR